MDQPQLCVPRFYQIKFLHLYVCTHAHVVVEGNLYPLPMVLRIEFKLGFMANSLINMSHLTSPSKLDAELKNQVPHKEYGDIAIWIVSPPTTEARQGLMRPTQTQTCVIALN